MDFRWVYQREREDLGLNSASVKWKHVWPGPFSGHSRIKVRVHTHRHEGGKDRLISWRKNGDTALKASERMKFKLHWKGFKKNSHHFLSLFLPVCSLSPLSRFVCAWVNHGLVFQRQYSFWVPALWLHTAGSSEPTCSWSAHLLQLHKVVVWLEALLDCWTKHLDFLARCVGLLLHICITYSSAQIFFGNQRAGICVWWEKFWGEKKLDLPVYLGFSNGDPLLEMLLSLCSCK